MLGELRRYQLTWASATVVVALPLSSLLIFASFAPFPLPLALGLGLPLAGFEALLILRIWAFAKCRPYLADIRELKVAMAQWDMHLRLVEGERQKLSHRIQRIRAQYGKAFEELQSLKEFIQEISRTDAENLSMKVLSWQAELSSQPLRSLRGALRRELREAGASLLYSKEKMLRICILRELMMERRLAERLSGLALWEDALALRAAEAEEIKGKLIRVKQALDQAKAAYQKAKTSPILLD
jgi:hypothetical protein